MSSRKKKISTDTLIFIDTNILLDYYRIKNSDISMKFLKEMKEHKDLLILTNQVEMEFRKNRQSVIDEALAEMKKLKVPQMSIPTILDSENAGLNAAKKAVKEQQERMTKKIKAMLSDPSANDEVFRTVQAIYATGSEYNLNRTNEQRYAIRKRALKRFMLGYPPRKKNDTSIGDAVNWEWIIDCAARGGKNVILVSRDGDYGMTFDDEPILNDWLQLEFLERVGSGRKVTLTNRLSQAFKKIAIPVTPEMEKAEEAVIEGRNTAFQESYIKRIYHYFNSKEEEDAAKVIALLQKRINELKHEEKK